MSRAYGWRPKHDPRSRNYPARALFAADAERRTQIWPCYARLDQGREGACVGFAVTHEVAAEPVAVRNVSNDIARAVYQRAQQLDQWPGEDYSGTSVNAGMKAGVERGWYGEYRWAFGEDDLALTVSYVGPVVIGVPWHEGMEKPDARGFVRPTGRVEGGHAICVKGYVVVQPLRGAWRRFWVSLTGQAREDYYVLHNSWGADWGKGGDCYLRRSDMAALLRQDGEAAIPVVRKGG